MRRYLLLPFCFFSLVLLGACVITPLAPTPVPQATPEPTFTATTAVTATAATTATTAITIAVTPTGTVTPTVGITGTGAVTATPALTTTPALTQTGAVTPSAQGISGTMATILAARPEFSTLNTAIEAVQLVEELNDDNPYTLFAPTNDAFAALPAGTLDALLAQPGTLASVIQNHLLIEEASSARLVRLGSVLTTLGQTLPVTLTADGVVQLGDATIIEPDIEATNGVIHGIDIVLLPADLVITPTVAVTAGAAAQVTATQAVTTAQQIITTIAPTATIADLVRTTDELERVETALSAAGLLQALQLPGQLTLFAPTNAAFEAIPPQQLQTLLNNTGQLATVMQYHLVADNVLAAELARLGTALSTSSQPLTITVAADGGVQVNNARIIQADIVTTNGVIHLIDAVLLPPAQ